MKKLLSVTVCAAVLLPLALAQDTRGSTETQDAPGAAPAPGKLQRVQAEEEAGAPDAARPGSELDLGQVVTLLTDPDLDQRERNFDRLVRTARVDRDVLKLLGDLAGSRVDVDLAWTARLALREVRRNGRFPRGFDGMPFTWNLPGLEDLQGFGLFDRGFLDPSLFGPGFRGNRRSIEIRQEGDEFVLRIHESEDGEEESTREYRGESLQDILDANPELRDEVGLGAEDVPGGLLFRMGPNPPSEHWRRLMRELREGPGDLFHLFGNPEPQDLKEFFQPLHSSRPVDPRILGVRVRDISSARAEELGLEPGVGLYVASVEPGSLAHLLGVGQGSVLLQLNDQPLRAAKDITRILAARAPQDPVHLLWIDGTGEKKTNVWRPGV